MSKRILLGDDALKSLIRGVELVAGATGRTLGPNGKNLIYEMVGTNRATSTRDGVTCMRQFDLADPFENMGAQMVRGVSEETVDAAGDGTTTAAILTQVILTEGYKAITAGANPVALKRGIERATAEVVRRLREMVIPVSGQMIRQVATISANNDEFLGGLIADAMAQAGDDGIVTVEISRKPESSLEIVDGLEFSCGYLSPHFVTNRERNQCILEDVAILLYEKKLATIIQMSAVLKQLKESGRTFLVIAEDVTDEALAVLEIAATNQDPRLMTLKCCAVKTPGFLEHLEDIAAMTRATVITELSGLKSKDIGLHHLGHAKKIIVKAQSTTIIADDAENPTLMRRLMELRTQVAEATEEGHKLRLQSRLARLAGGVAIIKVGAATELEMMERRDRIEDAMHATRCAKAEGCVVGGGMALIHALDISKLDLKGDELHGAQIICCACHAPLRTLAENSGKSADYIVERVLSAEMVGERYGWNARTNTFEDLVAAGILDPLRVVRVALESAASVAALALITHCLVANERK